MTTDMTEITWPVRLPFEIALGKTSLPTLLAQFNLTPEQWEALSNNSLFRRAVSLEMKEMQENGLTFRRKAQVMAEDYLMLIDSWIHSADTPLGTKIDLVKYTVECGDLRPKKDAAAGQAAGNGFNIQINIQN